MKNSTKKMLCIAAMPALALFSSRHAQADQNNINAAMKQAVADYKAGDETAMRDRARFCYDSVDYGRGKTGAVGAAKGVEYCMSYEFAAVSILSTKGKWNASAGYFSGADVITRAALYLDRAHVIVQQSDFNLYWQPRSEYIKEKIPGML